MDFGKSARLVCQQTCGIGSCYVGGLACQQKNRSVSKKIPRDEPAKKKELLCFVPKASYFFYEYTPYLQGMARQVEAAFEECREQIDQADLLKTTDWYIKFGFIGKEDTSTNREE